MDLRNAIDRIKSLHFIAVLFIALAYSPDGTLIAAPYTIENIYQKIKQQYPQIAFPVQIAVSELEQVGLVYKSIGERHLKLDIFRYPSPAKQGVLILIHGGGWSSGSKELLHPLARAIAKKGFVVASIEYRLSGEAKFPAGFEDARDAVQWLKLNAEQFGIDPNRVAIAGGSAGGQVAALLAYSGGTLDNENATEFLKFRALVNLDGLSDFTSAEALLFENDPKKKPSAAGAWFGGRYEEVPDMWKRASPFFYIDKTAPPTLFINSDQARFHAGRDTTITQLEKLSIPSKVVFFENSPHSFWHVEPWFTPTANAFVDFLKKYL